MSDWLFRSANHNDIPYLVDSIIEAEKSGTTQLTYSTIFGLTEEETRKYLIEMFEEDIDGCELSLSSCYVAEIHGELAGAVTGWIEGAEGMPSTVIKGNLLNYILPKEAMLKAAASKEVLNELRIETIEDNIYFGSAAVSPKHRGKGVVGRLMNEIIDKLQSVRPESMDTYLHVFGNNEAGIKAYEKIGFQIVGTKRSYLKGIESILPSTVKFLMKKPNKESHG